MTNATEYIKLQDSLPMAMPLVLSFLNSSRVVHLVILDKEGCIRFVNQNLSKFLKVDGAEVTGKNFINFFTGPDGETLSKRLTVGDISPDEELLLNIVDIDQFPHSLRFRLASLEDGFLVLGEPPLDDNQALQEELIQLNNQLSVLSRENVRKGRELARALADLKKTQAMLVHNEKMTSLWQMTAGIVHEINNPIAFVLGNEQVLKRDFDDLLAFINTLGDALPEIASLSPRIHSEIIGKAGEVGLEYLTEAVPRKIEANIEGLERVKQIVLDLRNFSRLDEADRKRCNLAEGTRQHFVFWDPCFRNME